MSDASQASSIPQYSFLASRSNAFGNKMSSPSVPPPEPDAEPPTEPSAEQLPSETLCYAFEQLAKGTTIVDISFGGQVYQLRRTRNGRLILTK